MGRVPTFATNNQMDINKLNLKIDDLKFHHIGYACKNIHDYKESFLLLSKDDDFNFIYEDIQQNVRAGFIRINNNLYVEILEVLNKDRYSPILNFIKKNVSGYHHICYQTNSFDNTINTIKSLGFRLISKTSNGFEKRHVAFFIPKKNPDGPLLEIVSSPL